MHCARERERHPVARRLQSPERTQRAHMLRTQACGHRAATEAYQGLLGDGKGHAGERRACGEEGGGGGRIVRVSQSDLDKRCRQSNKDGLDQNAPFRGVLFFPPSSEAFVVWRQHKYLRPCVREVEESRQEANVQMVAAISATFLGCVTHVPFGYRPQPLRSGSPLRASAATLLSE